MARRRRRSLAGVKVCKVVKGKVKCKSLSGMKRRKSRLGAMPKRSARTGRFVKG
jgi:hypothetical protein